MGGKASQKCRLTVASRAAHARKVVELVELSDLMETRRLLVKRVVRMRSAGGDRGQRLSPEVTQDPLTAIAVPRQLAAERHSSARVDVQLPRRKRVATLARNRHWAPVVENDGNDRVRRDPVHFPSDIAPFVWRQIQPGRGRLGG